MSTLSVLHPLDLRFEGFSSEAFAILSRLRRNPNVSQYRLEKPSIYRHLLEPFKRFRDDVVVNLILPNGLVLETERNVFSRLLKNDYGAGGSHAHLWMSFYRPGRTRLSDFQPFHAIRSEAFVSGLHAGGRDRTIARAAQEVLMLDAAASLARLNELFSTGGWTFVAESGTGRRRYETSSEISAFPEWIDRAVHLSIYRTFSRDAVLAWGADLVAHAIYAMSDVWWFYDAFTRRHRLAE